MVAPELVACGNTKMTLLDTNSENSIAFERGVPPLTEWLSTDQTIDRIYSWGLKASPQDNLTLSFTSQFVRN